MLRCIYNRGVDMHQTPYVHRMFRDVFTGIDTRQKKAIPINELHTLLNEDPQSDKLRRTQAYNSSSRTSGLSVLHIEWKE